MRLIDEKIKALGLTKGQYCEKYGYKFKDFAAKVHTLEAKMEWCDKFLEPLGSSISIRDKFRHVVSGLDTSAFKVGQLLCLDPENPGGLKAAQGGKVYFDKELKSFCMFTSPESASIQVVREGMVGELIDKGLGKGKLSPQDDADSLL